MALLSKRFIIPTLLITLIYILLVTYSMNLSILKEALLGGYGLDYKVGIFIALLQGMWTSMSGSGLMILFLTAFLTGANLTLLAQRVSYLGKTGNLHLMVGGGTLLGITASGCASCGLPVLALLGLSGSVLYLPLRGLELSYLAIALLLVSFYFQVKTDYRKLECKIEVRK